MSIVAVAIGLYFLFSAIVVVSICMISSRFSRQEELVEQWATQEWSRDQVPVPVKVRQEVGNVTRYA